jgi:TolA-binding protein
MKRILTCLFVLWLPVQVWAQQSPLDKANRAFLNREFKTASQLYQLGLESPFPSPDTAFALFQLGECYRLQGNWNMASRAYWKLTSEYSDSEWTDNAYLLLANHSDINNKEEIYQAVVIYETIITQYPTSDSAPTAFLALAKAKSSLHYFEAAEKTLNRLISTHPENPLTGDAYFELGQILANPQNPRKNTELAISNFLTVVTSYPHYEEMPTVLFSLGNLYWKQQRYTDAIHYFRETVNRHPNSFLAPLAQTNIGLCYTDMKDYNNAIKAYKTLLEEYSQPHSIRENILKLIERLQAQTKDRMQISAWVAEVNKKDRSATYEGDVKITFGKSVITADKAVVDLKNNTAAIEGNARLKWGIQLIVTADKMQCNFIGKSVIATGNVTLQRRFGKKLHEETWEAIEVSLTDGSSVGMAQEN